MATAAPNDPLLGRVIAEKYRLDAVAGTGATGTVYRAMHLTLGRPLAVKVLARHLMDNPTAQARFRREARAASKLEHPNSVQVVDFGVEADGITYLAMEFLEGRELYRAIFEDWPLGPERSAKIIAQVLSVLQAAHELGIVHRDLKPENVMLVQRPDEHGNIVEIVKVADFGIAKSIANTASEDSLNLTRDGTVHGTPEYMSPEQARGEELDGRADIYACGVMLYEMMTGTLPFTAESAFEVILKHLSDPVEPPTQRRPDADPRLESVVMKALAKRKQDRFADAKSMRIALLEALHVGAAAPSLPGAKAGHSMPPSADMTAAVPLMRKAGAHLPTEVLEVVSDDDVPTPLQKKSSSNALRIVLSIAALLAAIAVGAGVAWVIAQRSAQAPAAAPR
ncbi:MAG: serine/threonine protein kinase [Myxococcales bacterium]|nr:serine/threonine protein kinase [Myxococcales bacterium]